MRRTTIFLPEELDGDLEALARRTGKPLAGLVREALVEYVVKARRESARLPSFVGIEASGRDDIAERQEELLWKDPHGDAPPVSEAAPTLKPAVASASRRRRTRI